MKAFIEPEAEIVEFDKCDAIVASGGCPSDGTSQKDCWVDFENPYIDCFIDTNCILDWLFNR